MHVHGTSLDGSSAQLYAIAATERAAEAKSASETRKRLLKAADVVRAAESLDDTVFIGHWLHIDPEHEIVELTYGPDDVHSCEGSSESAMQ